MKKIILTTASTLLIAGGAIGFSMKANAEKTPTPENSVNTEHQEAQVDSETTNNFQEYDALNEVVDLDNLTIQDVEDNDYKHVMILKDDQNLPQFKSIYVKNKDRLKVIDFDKGLIFNQVLSAAEENDNADDHEVESNDNEVAEEDNEVTEQKEQKSGIEGFSEYSILDQETELDKYNANVVKDNNYKRLILLEDDNGQPQYKSIYIKNKDRLKIIDLNGGLLYNGTI